MKGQVSIPAAETCLSALEGVLVSRFERFVRH